MLDEEKAFIKAIANQPADDNVRLVYADWLTEHGDPNRAELIRVQCGLERGVDWQTGKKATDARVKKLKNREWNLIEALLDPKEPGPRPGVRELTPEIAALVVNDCEASIINFKRGMIEYLYLSNSSIAALPTGLYVSGDLDLSNDYNNNCHLHALPPDLHVGGNLNFRNSSISALPPGLYVGGNLDLSGTEIFALPPDLHVGGKLDVRDTDIRGDAARKILDMPGLSDQAKFTGLRSAGLRQLAAQFRQRSGGDAGPGTPPRP